MSENLKTQTVSFKKMYSLDEQSSFVTPAERKENLTTHQINTIQVQTPQIIKNAHIENKKQKKSSLKQANPYYSYIPKFYLKELRNIRNIFLLSLAAFVLCIIGIVVLVIVTFETDLINDYNPLVLLLLIPLIAFLLANLIVNSNRYRNFRTEARDINFKNDKVLSINVQKLYRRLKTGYINLNWFGIMTYIILLLAMLVDSIVVIFAKNGGSFADFDIPGNYTYAIVFWACVATIIIIFLFHIFTIVSNYIRSSNIENYYNYMIVDVNEINDIKKKKNRRDLFIFLTVIGSVIFLTWFIIHMIRGNQKQTKVIVK